MFKTETIESVDYKVLYEQQLEKNTKLEALISLLRKEKRALQLRDAPVTKWGFEWFSNLQYKVKSLTERVKAFESGEKYINMKAVFNTQLAEKDKENRGLKAELADSNAREITKNRHNQQVLEDMEKEHAKAVKRKGRETKTMEERALKAERQRDEWYDKYLEKNRELYQVKTELEEQKDIILKLMAQIKRDHENSSISSSLKPNKKKIPNNREKSGKKPGGQEGHPHHPRKRQTPTIKIDIPAPPQYADNPEYVATGKIITKQLIEMLIIPNIFEYSTQEFRHIRTGVRVHAKFPGGLVNDVTYGGSVKSLAFLLNSYCNVSIAKVSDFMRELTDGKLQLSTGMICGLTKEFSLKTEAEQKQAFTELLLAPVINTDFTTIRVNGKNVNALVCATPDVVQYYAKEHKGHAGIKDTPLETSQGIHVHDHDKTFFNYGSDNQDCQDHILRYLKGSMDNEPKLKWNKMMRELIREMIHFRKHLDPEDMRNPDEIDPEKVAALVARYDEVLSLAKEEYEYEPPSKYNRDGFNLYRRLAEYKHNCLLFLYDRRVPYSNSLSERMLRILKRKMHQVMTFRSFESFGFLCNCLGTIASLRAKEENLYQSVGTIFDRDLKNEENSAA